MDRMCSSSYLLDVSSSPTLHATLGTPLLRSLSECGRPWSDRWFDRRPLLPSAHLLLLSSSSPFFHEPHLLRSGSHPQLLRASPFFLRSGSHPQLLRASPFFLRSGFHPQLLRASPFFLRSGFHPQLLRASPFSSARAPTRSSSGLRPSSSAQVTHLQLSSPPLPPPPSLLRSGFHPQLLRASPFLPPLGLPPAAPLGFALLLLSARTGIDEAHIAACQACPPVSPGSVFSHDNIYRWGDRGDSRTQSDLVTLGMIYPPSTAMRFQRISPSDRPSSESLAPQLPSPLTRGRTAPAHPTSPTHLHHETRA